MIKIYYRGSCNSSKQAIRWFLEHNIPFERVPISQLSRREILRLLPLTDKGFTSFLKRPGKVGTETQKSIQVFMNLKFNDAVNYLNVNSELLQTPIIIEKEKFIVGYNKEEIRQFIPRSQRKVYGDKV